jgi:hypothetical protein
MVISFQEKRIILSDGSENVLGMLIGCIVSTLVAIPETPYHKKRRDQKAHCSYRQEGPGSHPLTAIDKTTDMVYAETYQNRAYDDCGKIKGRHIKRDCVKKYSVGQVEDDNY